MSKIQVSAKIKIPRGKIIEFKEAGTECEIREAYEDSEAVLKHQSNLRDLIMTIFENSELHTKLLFMVILPLKF